MNDEFLSYEKPPKEIYEKIKNNKVFIGCGIKSLYDEDRIKIKKQINPTRILHKNRNLYGILLDPIEKHLPIFDEFVIFGDFDLVSYNKLLSKNNLTCNENFAYLERNLYPIDSSYIYDYIPNFQYYDFFEDDSDMPIHQRIKTLYVFFLTPE
jgi:hypothetical protein